MTEISPEGEHRVRDLCDHCAQEEGLIPSAKQTTQVPFNEILSGLVVQQKATIQELAHLRCPKCNLTFVEFRNAGVLGCGHDYDAFEKALLPLIERAHENQSRHIGKAPRRLGISRPAENDLIKLRHELTRAVDDEQFEKAARLRDQIRTMEKP